VLWIHFVLGRFVSLFRSPVSAEDWLSVKPRFPVNFNEDVAFIAKTGYGTHHRLLAQLDALSAIMHDGAHGNTIVIADFATELHHDGHKVVVHDAIAPLAEDKTLVGKEGYERLLKYRDMHEAIRSGKREQAKALTKTFGWELDALKVSIASLTYLLRVELTWKQVHPGNGFSVPADAG
jgi:hypothetical protein